MKKKIVAILCVVVAVVALVVPSYAAEGSGALFPRPDLGSIKFTTMVGIIGQTTGIDPQYPYYIKGQFRFNEERLYIPIQTPSYVPSSETNWSISIASIMSSMQDPNIGRLSLAYSIDNEYLAEGELIFRFMIDSDDSMVSHLTHVYAQNYTGSAMLLWDYVDGMALGHNPLLNFGDSINGQGLTDGGAEWLRFYLTSTVDDIGNRPIDGFADFTSWLVTAVSGFMDFTLFGGFTIGDMLGTIVAFSFVMLFLKFFAGG